MESNVLKYWFWWPIRTLDTHEADTPPVMQIARNIYGTLVSEYVDGKAQGILAKDWTISSDGKEWKFKLREHLTFDDGSPITPESILLNFKRILWLTKEEGLVLNSLLPEVKHWKSMNEKSDNIFINKNHELVFRFIRRPISLFEAIGQPIYGIANPKCFDENGKWKDPMCTSSSGQYKIDKIESNYIQISSRKLFNAVDNAPDIIQIYWPTNKNDSVIKAIEERRADLTVEHSFALGSEKLKKLKNSGVQVEEEPPMRMHFVHLNHKRGPFLSKEIRQSFRDLFTIKLFANKDFLSSGITPDSSFIPKGGVGYKNYPMPSKPDMKKMNKSEIVEVLFYPISSDEKIQGSIEKSVIDSLNELGINYNIQKFSERFDAFNKMRNDQFDIIVRGSGILAHNPYGDLRMMFMSKLGARIPNPSNEIPKLIEEAEIEPDSVKRGHLVTKINDIIHDESVVINFAHSKLLYLSNKNLDFSRYNLYADPAEFRAIGWKK
jgi:ABC-type transport system substrate-binding protein